MTSKNTTGTVLSNKMNKTITVGVIKKIAHKKYSKIMSKTNKYYAHDEDNICQIGDIVLIKEIKPMSKKKKWLFIKKITNN